MQKIDFAIQNNLFVTLKLKLISSQIFLQRRHKELCQVRLSPILMNMSKQYHWEMGGQLNNHKNMVWAIYSWSS
jgi:hypothetical protein